MIYNQISPINYEEIFFNNNILKKNNKCKPSYHIKCKIFKEKHKLQCITNNTTLNKLSIQ